MRPVRVVVIDEDWWHPLELLPVEDQKPVEILAARGACVVRSVSTMTRMPHGVRPTQVSSTAAGKVWAKRVSAPQETPYPDQTFSGLAGGDRRQFGARRDLEFAEDVREVRGDGPP